MLEISLTLTDLDIIERALAIAIESGRMPNPELHGDDMRVSFLRKTLLAKQDEYLKDTWGGSRRRS